MQGRSEMVEVKERCTGSYTFPPVPCQDPHEAYILHFISEESPHKGRDIFPRPTQQLIKPPSGSWNFITVG